MELQDAITTIAARMTHDNVSGSEQERSIAFGTFDDPLIEAFHAIEQSNCAITVRKVIPTAVFLSFDPAKLGRDEVYIPMLDRLALLDSQRLNAEDSTAKEGGHAEQVRSSRNDEQTGRFKNGRGWGE